MAGISFSGLASGIDSEAIIKATIEARRIAAVPIENSKTFNTQETNSLEEFRTKLVSLSDSLKEFMTAYGGAISKNGQSSNTDVIGVSVGSNAPLSSTNVIVKQVARAAALSFDDRFSSTDTPVAPSLPGTTQLQFAVGLGDSQKTVSIDIDNTTTLSKLATDISESGDSALRASVINTGTDAAPSYVLLINSVGLGTQKGTISATVPPELTNLGLFSSSQMEQAQDAIINVSGIGDVIRPNNTIGDVIPGVTLELKQASALPIIVNIQNNYEKTADRIEEFVAKLNEAITFARDNSTIERKEDEDGDVSNAYSNLAKTRIDDQAMRAIQNAISDTHAPQDITAVRVFADLGLTITRDGTYSFNRAKFLTAAAKEPQATEDIISKFSDSIASTNGIIANYTKYQGQLDVAISANTKENESLTDKLDRLDRILEQQREAMKKMFMAFEMRISNLNASANALTSILGGASTK